jgi:hypothetical protein
LYIARVYVVAIGVATVNSIAITDHEGRKGEMRAKNGDEQFKLKYPIPINCNVIRLNHSGIESGSYTPECSRVLFYTFQAKSEPIALFDSPDTSMTSV